MSQVYLCEHAVMKHRVAMKLLPVRESEDRAAVSRFMREARMPASRGAILDRFGEPLNRADPGVVEVVRGRTPWSGSLVKLAKLAAAAAVLDVKLAVRPRRALADGG